MEKFAPAILNRFFQKTFRGPGISESDLRRNRLLERKLKVCEVAYSYGGLHDRSVNHLVKPVQRALSQY